MTKRGSDLAATGSICTTKITGLEPFAIATAGSRFMMTWSSVDYTGGTPTVPADV